MNNLNVWVYIFRIFLAFLRIVLCLKIVFNWEIKSDNETGERDIKSNDWAVLTSRI